MYVARGLVTTGRLTGCMRLLGTHDGAVDFCGCQSPGMHCKVAASRKQQLPQAGVAVHGARGSTVAGTTRILKSAVREPMGLLHETLVRVRGHVVYR